MDVAVSVHPRGNAVGRSSEPDRRTVTETGEWGEAMGADMTHQNDPGSARPECGGGVQNQPPAQTGGGGGLPWGFVAVAAAAFFLYSNRQSLAGDGAFIYIVGAVILGVMSANMLARR